jgi:hypothetical protein
MRAGVNGRYSRRSPLPGQICRSCLQPPAPAPSLPGSDEPLPHRWPGFASSVLDYRKRTRSRPGASLRFGSATSCSPCTRPPIIIMAVGARQCGARPDRATRPSWSEPHRSASSYRPMSAPVDGWESGWMAQSTGPNWLICCMIPTGWWRRRGSSHRHVLLDPPVAALLILPDVPIASASGAVAVLAAPPGATAIL